MKFATKASLILLFTAVSARAGVINFDEVPAPNNGSPYAGTATVTFSPTNAGIWGGNSAGNPGNWNLEGTNGRQFLGFNGFGGGGLAYTQTVDFSSAVSTVSVDFARSEGSSDGTILLEAFQGASLLASAVAILGDINQWSTLSIASSGITSIRWSGMGSGFHPYGVDNLRFGEAATTIPEPSTLMLMAFAGLGLVARLRRPN